MHFDRNALSAASNRQQIVPRGLERQWRRARKRISAPWADCTKYQVACKRVVARGIFNCSGGTATPKFDAASVRSPSPIRGIERDRRIAPSPAIENCFAGVSQHGASFLRHAYIDTHQKSHPKVPPDNDGARRDLNKWLEILVQLGGLEPPTSGSTKRWTAYAAVPRRIQWCCLAGKTASAHARHAG